MIYLEGILSRGMETEPSSRVVTNEEGEITASWQGKRSLLTLRTDSVGKVLSQYRLQDGIACVAGSLFELIDTFTPSMDAVFPPSHLEGCTSKEAIRLLTHGNGVFLGIVVREPGRAAQEPDTTVIVPGTPWRTTYYGPTPGGSVVSTSPQWVSDRIGAARRVNRDRIVDICLHRNLVDDQTLFENVFRLQTHQTLHLGENGFEVKDVDLSDLSMSLPDTREKDPLFLDLGKTLLRRAVKIRKTPEPVTLLLSGGMDSRTLLALAREAEIRDVVNVSIGRKKGEDESLIANDYARELGYSCHRFHEEDLEFEGLLEPYLESMAHPPKYYNFLPLRAALAKMEPLGGQLWTGDAGTIEGLALPFVQLEQFQGTRWTPPRSMARVGLSLKEILPQRLARASWLFSLTRAEAAAVSLCPERSVESCRDALSLFQRPVADRVRVPQMTPGMGEAVQRFGPCPGWPQWVSLWGDVVFSGAAMSRSLLAESMGCTTSFPYRDASLMAFSLGPMATLPPRYLFAKKWKEKIFESWLPRSKWGPKMRLVGGLKDWFADPKKLAPYLDYLDTRAAKERGIFRRNRVEGLLERSASLSEREARLLWMILTTEMLFARHVVRDGGKL